MHCEISKALCAAPNRKSAAAALALSLLSFGYAPWGSAQDEAHSPTRKQAEAQSQSQSKSESAAKNEAKSGDCKISCVAPYAADDESQKVIKVVEQITRALADRKFDVMMQHMDPGCSTYDESTKRTVVGPENIIADVKRKIALEEAKSHAPIVSYKIDSPFARVKGDTAVVCFVLVKELGGNHPQTFEEHCTDVFVKHGDEWKKLNFRGSGWKHK